ncbi:hypothetical protein [Dactylosporangium sp. CA-139066]|uniref:hypothetical protein n=1 Tax=Dactylosporangium sp. CA-139066 TaxID=3239930 RepID=UPI003D8C1B79
MTAVLARTTVEVNPSYVHRTNDLVQAVRLPSGRWAVKVRQVRGGWLGCAVSLGDGSAFSLVFGPDAGEVFAVAVRWADSARTLGMRMDRVVFAGYGDALGERPVDVDELAAA